ncbi:hypothetical protein M1446_05760 [Candidatus Dependentiae bacterium]|nr:hypothetical protein [Candidatus Dependentiae bacterium]
MKKFILICLLSISIHDSLAIRPATATGITIGVGGLALANVYRSYTQERDQFSFIPDKNIALFLSITLGASIAAITHMSAQSCTPKARLDEAQTKLKEVSNNNFVKTTFSSDQEFIDDINIYFIKSVRPLAAAFYNFIKLQNNIETAQQLINAAKPDLDLDDPNYSLTDQLLQDAKTFELILSKLILVLKKQPDFMRQLKEQEEIDTAREAALAAKEQAAATRSIATSNLITRRY